MNAFDWPQCRRYENENLARIALPLGGLGTGAITLGGRGDLRDWEIVNRPAQGFAPHQSFWALHVADGENTVTRCLEGPLDLSLYASADGHRGLAFGLPRFRQCAFEAAYPLGQVVLSDDDVPLQVRLGAFNPFVPGDAPASSWPVAVLRWQLHNPTDRVLNASVCGNFENFIGSDGTEGAAKNNRNQWRETPNARGVFAFSQGVAADDAAFGTLALGVLNAHARVSHRTAWAPFSWGDSLLDFWDDFSDDGRLEARENPSDAPMLSLCAQIEIAPGETGELTFVLAWHFPNRQTWTPCDGLELKAIGRGGVSGGAHRTGPPTIGNFYTTRWSDAWDVVESLAPQLPALEVRTLRFARAFYECDLPLEIKEAAGFNLSTLRSPTCFQTPDGYFWGWEGVFEREGSCYGSCNHVWNYELALCHLFGDLARSMREVEFTHATDARGLMSFRVGLPLQYATKQGIAAADGQTGCLVKLLRDWKLCGDDAFLQKLWPGAKRALEFCWIEGGWDADRDGVMEGAQHNTMDVEYFGPNPQMQSWYLAALKAGETLARHLGDDELAATCRRLFQSGARWTDEHLWNGDYYEQQIRPPYNADAIAPGLMLGAGAKNLIEPEFQVGAGCLVDQLVGVTMARVADLGEILEPAHVRKTLDSVVRFNRRESLHGHFNPMRSYALGDETALLMVSFPRGERPARPFPYHGEVMTGFEYVVAAHLLFEGERDEGLRIVRDIRARYDGRKRNPFDETECGRHYARALCSWGAVLGWTGFNCDSARGALSFRAATEPSNWFWSNGAAWGTIEQQPRAGAIEVTLRLEGGNFALQSFTLREFGTREFEAPQPLAIGADFSFQVEEIGSYATHP